MQFVAFTADVEQRGRCMVRDYLDSLPDGPLSYASFEAKGSLVRAYLASKPLKESDVPNVLRDVVAHPPVTGAWIPEVQFLSIALAVRERHFSTDAAFLAWVRELNAELFRGPIYRALMAVSSTRLLAAGSALRWRQFHRNATLTTEHGAGSSMDLTFTYAPRLFTQLHVRLFSAAIEAAVEAAGGKHARTEWVEYQESKSRARIVW